MRVSIRRAWALLAIVATLVGSQPPSGATAGPAGDRPPAGVWTGSPAGFASLAGYGIAGTTGGAAGRVVTASTLDELTRYANAAEPLVVRVRGTITVEPFGAMVPVGSDKTIVGLGGDAELVGGGLYLNEVHNVIVRNLTIRDSYLPGDWDGKDPTNDNDGIRVDTSTHVWIDHNRIERVGDGLIDIRKDSDLVTVSWNIVGDANKALGVGWTSNVLTRITAHHNWVRNTYQRNWSIDNTAAAHLYNNYLTDIGLYGTMSRGAARVVVENSVFERVNDPLVAKDPASALTERGNVFTRVSGRRDATGTTFEPSAHYAYRADPAAEVPALLRAYAGPRHAERPPVTPRTITVALDGSGHFGSLQAALGATRDARGPVTIVVKPGTYREVVRVWDDQPGLTIRGATGDPRDVVIAYDLPAGGEKFYGGTYGSAGSPTFTVLAADTTVRDLTVTNTYDESVTPSQALAVRTVGDRATFVRTRFLGDQDTYKADSPHRDTVSRTYLRDCYIEGDVGFIYGRGAAVFDHCTIHSSDRGTPTNNGWVTAASTSDDNPYGFLFVRCAFTSDAAPGSVHLGRPWHPGGDVRAIGQVLIRESVLGAHIKATPWTEMSGFPWQQARFAEYHNTGPGAAVNADRPQLDPSTAAAYTRAAYLAGPDDWRPWRRGW
jgi:pectate lyase